MKYAIIEAGKVTNVIELKDGAKYKLPSGQKLVKADVRTEIDGTYANNKFTKAVRVVDPKHLEDVERDRVWKLAEDHYLYNGTHEFSDLVTQRCVTSNRRRCMSDECWNVLKAQYPK